MCAICRTQPIPPQRLVRPDRSTLVLRIRVAVELLGNTAKVLADVPPVDPPRQLPQFLRLGTALLGRVQRKPHHTPEFLGVLILECEPRDRIPTCRDVWVDVGPRAVDLVPRH